MNTNEYIHLLNNSKSINERQTMQLEQIVQVFPYFQSARALYLKGLYNQDSYRYNYELKKTASHTTDRTMLFDFITTNDFKIFESDVYQKYQEVIENIEVNEFEFIEVSGLNVSNQINLKKESNFTVENTILGEVNVPNLSAEENNLQIGKPLQFDKNEKYSFNEWLKLSKLTPIERENEPKTPISNTELDKKIALIENFIQANPKMSQPKETTPAPLNIAKSNELPSSVMTETLAQIYLEQKKYTKAIQAYEILILKFPEKSSFFADRIENIKIFK
jgi:tetratricopeptide (TPR) repeat protein